ncbi:hypothetical protein BJI49_13195 [Acetobacter pasteurianus]|nr:hypothetical protein BJI49_13195 [Acetobacter pasteurianus]
MVFEIFIAKMEGSKGRYLKKLCSDWELAEQVLMVLRDCIDSAWEALDCYLAVQFRREEN